MGKELTDEERTQVARAVVKDERKKSSRAKEDRVKAKAIDAAGAPLAKRKQSGVERVELDDREAEFSIKVMGNKDRVIEKVGAKDNKDDALEAARERFEIAVATRSKQQGDRRRAIACGCGTVQASDDAECTEYCAAKADLSTKCNEAYNADKELYDAEQLFSQDIDDTLCDEGLSEDAADLCAQEADDMSDLLAPVNACADGDFASTSPVPTTSEGGSGDDTDLDGAESTSGSSSLSLTTSLALCAIAKLYL